MRFLAAVVAALVLFQVSAQAQTRAQTSAQTIPAPAKSGLTRLLEGELGGSRGPGGPYKAGIYVKYLPTGEEASVLPNDHFNSASVIKLAVLVLAFQMADKHKLNLNERYEVTPADFRTGSGVFRYNDTGLKPTLRDVLTQMVITSDNTATDIMIAKVGGMDAVNAFLKGAGYAVLHLNHTLLDGSKARYVMLDPTYASLTGEQVFALQSDVPALTAKYRSPHRRREKEDCRQRHRQAHGGLQRPGRPLARHRLGRRTGAPPGRHRARRHRLQGKLRRDEAHHAGAAGGDPQNPALPQRAGGP